MSIPQSSRNLNTIPKRAARLTPATPQPSGTRLAALMLERNGYPAEILYVPQCHSCGRLILDFRTANVSTVRETEADLVPIGKIGNADASFIPCEGAFVFCKSCDNTSHGSWVGAHCVFKNDQRYAFEKFGGAE